jgi:flagellar motor switch protein FliG
VTDTDSKPPANLSDLEKSAVVLMSIGQDAAAEVVKSLSQLEINLLGVAMARIAQVPKEAAAAVYREFADLLVQDGALAIGAEDYVREVLEKALGHDRAGRLVGRMKLGDYSAGLEAIQWQDPRALGELIKAEHPQVIAMILANLEPEQGQALIQHLPEEVVAQAIPRLAMLDTVPPNVIRELNDTLEQLLSGNVGRAAIPVGGVEAAAKLLNRMGDTAAQRVLKTIGEVDPVAAQMLTEKMFVFEDLFVVDDRNFQVLLRAVDQNLLVVALKGASENLKEKVFKNMSQRAAEMVREELEARGPMRVAEVDAAKREIVAAAMALEREGKMILRVNPTDIVA